MSCENECREHLRMQNPAEIPSARSVIYIVYMLP